MTPGAAIPAAFAAWLTAGRARCRICSPIKGDPRMALLPVSLRILAENVLRTAPRGIEAFGSWLANGGRTVKEIAFRPSRVLMHDTTCVPALVDLAILRDAVAQRGGDPRKINPAIPVDLVIDHSVIVDHYGSADAFSLNLEREFERNAERYAFIKWAEKNLANFRVVPPGVGIIHQINLEHLSEVVRVDRSGASPVLYPDTLVGTDSHTPMVNALGIVGWGVGGIEGLAASLGQPLFLRVPEVVGVRLSGRLRPGVTATDLALTLTSLFRKRGVVDKIVEFTGPGVGSLSVADRATVSNMAPEYGATCSYFPIDERTIDYLRMVGRPEDHLVMVEAYARAQHLWHQPGSPAVFTETVDFGLDGVETTLAGPKRPEDKVTLGQVAPSFLEIIPELSDHKRTAPQSVAVPGETYSLRDGAVLIAAITSCTNTSNPALMVGAGLLARKARAAGLRVPPWVKTSLSPGSEVVTDYLKAAGLLEDLGALGFQLTGHGCMTCIGNSGPLSGVITDLTRSKATIGAAVLSGNRNFQGRIHPSISAAYLASPALVVAYALKGTVLADLRHEPVSTGPSGEAVTLEQIWPSDGEIQEVVAGVVGPNAFRARSDVFSGPDQWRRLSAGGGVTYAWRADSTYLRPPPYFDDMPAAPAPPNDIVGARALLVLGDNVTTDHISPAGAILPGSLAGDYLAARGVPVSEFNQYSTRRGNHEVMLRGLFSNARLQNRIVGGTMLGGVTRGPSGEILPIYEAAGAFRRAGIPLIIIAGREYGAGSSRDWAAKGPALLGVRAVIAESFERIHRSNLIGMGVLPLQFAAGHTQEGLQLDGSESFDLTGLAGGLGVGQPVTLVVRRNGPEARSFPLTLRAETELDVEYLRHGGLLRCLLRK